MPPVMPSAIVDPETVWAETSLMLTMTVTYTGQLYCDSNSSSDSQWPASGYPVTSAVRMQPQQLRLFVPVSQIFDAEGQQVAPNTPVLTQERADALASAVSLDSTGMILLDSSGLADLWWAEVEPLRIAPEPLTWLAQQADYVCQLLNASVTGVASPEMVEFVPPVPILAASTGVSILSINMDNNNGQPQLLQGAPGIYCGVWCAQGSQLTLMTNQRAGVWPTTVVPNPQGFLPVALSRCVGWLVDAYTTCGVKKGIADTQFARCAGVASGNGNLPIWWARQLPLYNVSLLVNGTVGALAGLFTCPTFVAMQREHCTCTNVAAAPTTAANPATPAFGLATMGCVNASTSGATDGASASVEARLIELGYLLPTFQTNINAASDRAHA